MTFECHLFHGVNFISKSLCFDFIFDIIKWIYEWILQEKQMQDHTDSMSSLWWGYWIALHSGICAATEKNHMVLILGRKWAFHLKCLVMNENSPCCLKHYYRKMDLITLARLMLTHLSKRGCAVLIFETIPHHKSTDWWIAMYWGLMWLKWMIAE